MKRSRAAIKKMKADWLKSNNERLTTNAGNAGHTINSINAMNSINRICERLKAHGNRKLACQDSRGRGSKGMGKSQKGRQSS